VLRSGAFGLVLIDTDVDANEAPVRPGMCELTFSTTAASRTHIARELQPRRHFARGTLPTRTYCGVGESGARGFRNITIDSLFEEPSSANALLISRGMLEHIGIHARCHPRRVHQPQSYPRRHNRVVQ